MTSKIRVAVLFGGQSAEHEVSLQSARNVIEAMDKDKYEAVLVGITKEGQWRLNEASSYLLNENNPKLIALNKAGDNLALAPGDHAGPLLALPKQQNLGPIDVVFPVLHGPFGEDGTVQGLLKLAGLPFVGCSVLGSAVGMDKDVMKRLMRDAGIPNARFVIVHRHELDSCDLKSIIETIGLPLFVKPANLGSSVGISKVSAAENLEPAIREALNFDGKVVIEEAIAGREIECSVLGNEEPIASVPGEVIPTHEFYSYEAKYIDEKGALLEIPAKLEADTIRRVQELAVRTFRVLCLEGMSRVDMFLKLNGELFVNEVNTIPGFTKISMYPKLWEATGLPYAKLIDRLIELAIDRHKREKALKTSL